MAKALAFVVATMLLASTATAGGIVCHDEYQVVNGQEIHTPYCADGYIAKVARKSGWKVTDKQIRQNPNLKEEVCRHIGGDIRVREDCDYEYGDGDGSP